MSFMFKKRSFEEGCKCPLPESVLRMLQRFLPVCLVQRSFTLTNVPMAGRFMGAGFCASLHHHPV